MAKNYRLGKLQLLFLRKKKENEGEDKMSNKNNGKNQPDKRKDTTIYNGFFWDCDKCGQENFERGIVPEIDKDIIAAVKELHNIDNNTAHIMIHTPDVVKCKSCHEEYNSVLDTF